MNLTGAAIISNSHIYQTNKLLYDNSVSSHKLLSFKKAGPQPITDNQLNDLFTLLDAIILNDQLYSLPASSGNIKNPLADVLSSGNVVQTLDREFLPDDLGKQIILTLREVWMNSTKDPRYEDHDMTMDDRLLDDPVVWIQGIRIRTDFMESRVRSFDTEGAKERAWIIDSNNDLLPADVLAKFVDDLLTALSSTQPALTFGDPVYVLREMYYVYAAEALKVPYYAKANRIAFADKFPNYYDAQFKNKLYETIAKALKATVEEVFEDFVEKPGYIPPFASIIFDRSQKKEDIIKNALEMREEFAGTRKAFNDMEKERTECRTLKERLKVAQRQQKLLEDAARAYRQPSKINLQASIKYIPEVIKPLTAPQDPTKYSANLLLLPVEYLLEWWRKRPVKRMFSLKDRLFEIKDYDRLISKFFERV